MCGHIVSHGLQQGDGTDAGLLPGIHSTVMVRCSEAVTLGVLRAQHSNTGCRAASFTSSVGCPFITLVWKMRA